MLPSRADALALVHEYTQSDSLRKHMLAVEAAMRAYARRFGEDEERWGLAGLLHGHKVWHRTPALRVPRKFPGSPRGDTRDGQSVRLHLRDQGKNSALRNRISTPGDSDLSSGSG